MVFFLVWECYTQDWKLKEKGNYFLRTDELGQVDLLVAEFEEAMADARDIDPKYFLVTSCQQISTRLTKN